MPSETIGYVNVLMDWNQDGDWMDAGEHVLVDWVIPNPYDGPLSLLGPPSFVIGPNPGYVWSRFTITEVPLGAGWFGEGAFEDGETEDYLLEVIIDTITVDIPLHTGWNLITNPVNNSWNASDIAANVTGCLSVVDWIESSQSYWFYLPGFPAFDFQLQNGEGYFVEMSGSDTLTITGPPIDNVDVSLLTGWNLIGWYNQSDSTAISLAENITDCTSVVKWDPVGQSYWFYLPGFPAFDFTVTCGMGVFIEVSSTSTWQGEG